jgi:hypothetical protein
MNDRRSGFRHLLWLIAALAVISCGINPRAKTAQEFVTKYAEAYRTGDVNAITAMTIVDTGAAEQCFRKNVRHDIASQGFGYAAWTRTRYVSESDHGNCIHVDVEVAHARSSVVLVKKDSVLKIVQNPSDYN